MSYINREKKVLIFKYLDTPEEERDPVKDFMHNNHILRVVYGKGELLYIQEHKAELMKLRDTALRHREATNRLGDDLIEDNYDSEVYLDGKTHKVDAALLEACKKGSPGALKIYYQLMNRLVEKTEQEVKLGLSADELARRNLAAERELESGRETGYRVEEVSEKPSLLSK